jgi:PAS domain-containing protein
VPASKDQVILNHDLGASLKKERMSLRRIAGNNAEVLMRRREVVTEAFDPTVSPAFGKPTGLSGPDLRFRLVSDDYCAVLQRSREALLNVNWTSIIHPDDLAEPSAKQAILFATGEPYDVTCRIRRGDGRWVRGHFRASRTYARNGSPLIQSNGWFEPVPEQAQPAQDQALVEYIQVATAELAKMADGQGLGLLGHLLSMASLEAAQELERLYPGCKAWSLPDRLN